MQFYTPAWYHGHAPWDAGARYRAHIEALFPQLPPPLRALADLSLHDGRIREATYDPSGQHFVLRLRCGDASLGYYDLSLGYDGASFGDMSLVDLDRLLGDERTEILYDELHPANGCWEHRFLLWPTQELGIRFWSLGLSLRPAPGRDFDSVEPRFRLL